MIALLQREFSLSAPLFLLIGLGYALIRHGRWSSAVAGGMNTFVFQLALPALLFLLMSDRSRFPHADPRLLLAFFGACLLSFLAAAWVARRLLHLDGQSSAILAVSGIFSNNVLLGIPLARAALGTRAIPAVALVLVFNALTLWTLVSVAIEWARQGRAGLAGLGGTLRALVRNPIVMAIVGGTAFGFTGLVLPEILDTTLHQVAEPAAPLSLIVLGMGLAEFGLEADRRQIVTICVFKLAIQPALVWTLARLIGLPALETQVVVLLGSLPVGANVYLMSTQYQRLEGTVAASLVVSTLLSALTTPLLLLLLTQAAPA